MEIKCYFTQKKIYSGNFVARKFRKFTEIFLTVLVSSTENEHQAPVPFNDLTITSFALHSSYSFFFIHQYFMNTWILSHVPKTGNIWI